MIGIINFRTGHLNNLAAAVKKAGGEVALLDDVTDCSNDIEKVIIYSSLSISECMQFLRDYEFVDYLKEIISKDVPVLAINSGMHCLFENFEFDEIRGLGLIQGNVKTLEKTVLGAKYWTGWLNIKFEPENQDEYAKIALFEGIDLSKQPMFYFNQKNFVVPTSKDIAMIYANYELQGVQNNEDGRKAELLLPVALRYNNIFGVQFLPEKSNHLGIKVLKNFVALTP